MSSCSFDTSASYRSKLLRYEPVVKNIETPSQRNPVDWNTPPILAIRHGMLCEKQGYQPLNSLTVSLSFLPGIKANGTIPLTCMSGP